MAKHGINIYRRRDGRWEGRYSAGRSDSGRIKYKSVYGRTYRGVKSALMAIKSGSDRAAQGVDFADIIDKWECGVVNTVKPSTFANYQTKINKHILPYFQGVKYEQVTAEKINEFITDKINSGLSAGYVANIVALIKSIANYAAMNFECTDKIANVPLPRSYGTREIKTISADDKTRIRQYIFAHPTMSNCGILLAMATGVRIGELCALKWSDVDIDKKILSVRRTAQRVSTGSGTELVVLPPKTKTSQRDIPLPDFVVPMLRKFKSSDDYYILSGNQNITDPRTMQNRFRRLLEQAGAERVNFHVLRHTFATDCVAAGCDVKTLSEILGHSSTGVTLSRYIHPSMQSKKNCISAIFDEYSNG